MTNRPDYTRGTIPQITLPVRLRLAREHAGLQQAQLADLVGVARNTISRAESGAAAPGRPLLLSWAMATGVPLGWILTGEAGAGARAGGGGRSSAAAVARVG